MLTWVARGLDGQGLQPQSISVIGGAARDFGGEVSYEQQRRTSETQPCVG